MVILCNLSAICKFSFVLTGSSPFVDHSPSHSFRNFLFRYLEANECTEWWVNNNSNEACPIFLKEILRRALIYWASLTAIELEFIHHWTIKWAILNEQPINSHTVSRLGFSQTVIADCETKIQLDKFNSSAPDWISSVSTERPPVLAALEKGGNDWTVHTFWVGWVRMKLRQSSIFRETRP